MLKKQNIDFNEEGVKALDEKQASDKIERLLASGVEKNGQSTEINQRQLDILKGMAIKKAAEMTSEDELKTFTDYEWFIDAAKTIYNTYKTALQALHEADKEVLK